MSDITFVQGDTAPSISGSLTDADGSPLDLTSADVKFQMRLIDDRRFKVDATAIIVNEDAGTVRYDWVTGDLDTPGEYQAQWQVTFNDNSIQTTTPANTITVRPA